MKEKKSYSLSLANKKDFNNINEWVYQTLRTSIMCGEIRPGVALTIRGLAEKLDVSSMPVREALRRLASESAVDITDSRRVIVPLISPDKFKELYSLRILLETHAAELALPYISEKQVEHLIMLDKEVDASYSDGDIVSGSLANQAFHRYIYKQNPVQVCMPMIESLWLQLGPFARVALSKIEKYYEYDRHQEALEAIQQRDSFALRRAIEADIRDGLSVFKNIDEIYHDLKSSE